MSVARRASGCPWRERRCEQLLSCPLSVLNPPSNSLTPSSFTPPPSLAMSSPECEILTPAGTSLTHPELTRGLTGDAPSSEGSRSEAEVGDSEDQEIEYEVEKILSAHDMGKGVIKYWVRWKGYPDVSHARTPSNLRTLTSTESFAERRRHLGTSDSQSNDLYQAACTKLTGVVRCRP